VTKNGVRRRSFINWVSGIRIVISFWDKTYSACMTVNESCADRLRPAPHRGVEHEVQPHPTARWPLGAGRSHRQRWPDSQRAHARVCEAEGQDRTEKTACGHQRLPVSMLPAHVRNVVQDRRLRGGVLKTTLAPLVVDSTIPLLNASHHHAKQPLSLVTPKRAEKGHTILTKAPSLHQH
jgi:hypothetical protein